jgi:hypothetical protein
MGALRRIEGAALLKVCEVSWRANRPAKAVDAMMCRYVMLRLKVCV